MAIAAHEFYFDSINSSIQVGDLVYYISTATQGAFTQGSGNITLLGVATGVGNNYVQVTYDNTGPSLPVPTDYLMFGKNPEANVSRLLGYYMEVNFSNNSQEYAELFSVGSEISESSK